MRRMGLVVAILPLVAGCLGSQVDRDEVAFDVVSDVAGRDGVRVTDNPANGSVEIGLGPSVGVRGLVTACRAECDPFSAPEGMLVAEGSVISFNNVSLNARGPDRDSSVFFHDGGLQSGQYLRWRDGRDRFEASRDLDVLGNLTARHHVGTVTAILLGGGAGVAQVATAALEGNEASVFLRGGSKLVNGSVNVTFPDVFKVLVGQGPLTVQLTLTAKGPPLYVAEKSIHGFRVEAADGSPSSATFDYFVQATRAASEDFETVRAG